MAAIQLDLFSGDVIASPAFPGNDSVCSADMPQVINPCLQCEFYGLCPEDECGATLFPIDAPCEDFMSEKEYQELLFRTGLK